MFFQRFNLNSPHRVKIETIIPIYFWRKLTVNNSFFWTYIKSGENFLAGGGKNGMEQKSNNFYSIR